MKKFLFFVIVCSAISSYSFAQDLVFTFTNPAFGGDTFNYQWLLSSAEAQNIYSDSQQQQLSGLQNDPLTDFENSLNKQILSRLSKNIVDSLFGEEEMGDGTYVFGSYQIEIGDIGDGLSIVIFDLSSGDQSTIFIPYY